MGTRYVLFSSNFSQLREVSRDRARQEIQAKDGPRKSSTGGILAHSNDSNEHYRPFNRNKLSWLSSRQQSLNCEGQSKLSDTNSWRTVQSQTNQLAVGGCFKELKQINRVVLAIILERTTIYPNPMKTIRANLAEWMALEGRRSWVSVMITAVSSH